MYTQHMFGLTCVFLCKSFFIFSCPCGAKVVSLQHHFEAMLVQHPTGKQSKKTHLIMLIIIAIICLLCILVAERQFFAAQRCYTFATTPRFSPSIAKGFHRLCKTNSS